MKNKVVALVTTRHQHSRGVLECIKNARTMIKDETITGIAIAAVGPDGYSRTLYEAGENMAMLVGAIERVKYRLLVHQDEED